MEICPVCHDEHKNIEDTSDCINKLVRLVGWDYFQSEKLRPEYRKVLKQTRTYLGQFKRGK